MAFSYLVVSTIYTEASVHPQVMVNSTMVHFDPDRTAQVRNEIYNHVLLILFD